MRGAILAGGAASRFNGKPKGLEQVGGERIIDRVVQTVGAAIGETPILVANDPNASEWRPDLHVIRDAIRHCGSLGGIYTALSAGKGPVLVVAWDMPFVSVELLEALVEGANGYDVFLPQGEGPGTGMEPLCGVYGPACLNPIRQRLADEDFRATGFHHAIKLGTLPIEAVKQLGEPQTLFFNVNTEDDLGKAQEIWRGQFEK